MFRRCLVSRFNLSVLLVTEHNTAHTSSCKITGHLMNDKPRGKIEYSHRGHCPTAGVAFASHIIFTNQTSCISQQNEYFSGSPNCATIQHGYQHLAVDNAHTTDVIGQRMRHCSLCDAFVSSTTGIFTGKLKIYRIDGWKYFAKDECNTIRIAPRRNKDRSSGVIRPSDVSVTVNINAEFHLSLI